MRNTQQITKAMKQVAAAKIRRAEAAQKQARPYAEGIAAMLNDLMNAVGNVDHPFMQPGKAGAPSGVILMTADKGLAGAFNSNVIRAGELFARERPVAWYPVGNKAISAVRRRGELGEFSTALSGKLLENAQHVAQRVTDDFVAGRISEIVLVAAEFVSMMVQRPQTRTLVPIVAEKRERQGEGPRGAVEFAPSPEAVLKSLLPKYLEFTLYSAMLETD